MKPTPIQELPHWRPGLPKDKEKYGVLFAIAVQICMAAGYDSGAIVDLDEGKTAFAVRFKNRDEFNRFSYWFGFNLGQYERDHPGSDMRGLNKEAGMREDKEDGVLCLVWPGIEIEHTIRTDA